MKKVFSSEYKNLKDTIMTLGNNFILIDLEKIFLEFEKYGLNLKDSLDYAELVVLKAKIDKKIKAKQNDLNLKTDFNNDTDFKNFLVELAKLTDVFNGIVAQQLGDRLKMLSLREELKRRELTKYRFAKEGVSIFIDYNKAKKDLETQKKEIKKLNTELTEKVNIVFKENEKQINGFLKKLSANFALKDFSPKSHMGLTNTHFCDFHFVIDNKYEIKVSNKTRSTEPEPEDKPHFKNTLSDSDRRLLAFAFFLSKLSNDNNLKDKIVVLDDPFSSFDENRKEETVNLLADIKNSKGNTPAQKIFLTHDKGFLCRLFDKLPKDSSKVLKIHYSPTNGSVLEVCDVEDDYIKDVYFKDIEYIKSSIEGSINIDEALKKARPCLEHLLKRKYYFLLKPETLSRKSVGEYLKEIDTACPLKNEILTDNWHEDMHDSHQTMKLNEPAKIEKLKRFLELIKEV
jgi:wobble nucleotide-excising tRNase